MYRLTSKLCHFDPVVLRPLAFKWLQILNIGGTPAPEKFKKSKNTPS